MAAKSGPIPPPSAIPPDTPHSGTIFRAPDFSEGWATAGARKAGHANKSPHFGVIPPGGAASSSSPGEIAARAATVTADFPSIWFVNFPDDVSAEQQRKLQEAQQEILNYRSWSSLKWWTEVFSQIPQSGGRDIQKMQSRALSGIAYLDMVNTSWFDTPTISQESSRHIQCKKSELTTRLIQEIFAGFIELDSTNVIVAIDPLMEMIRDSIDATSEIDEIKTLVIETYQWSNMINNFRSFVRLICFEATDDFYNVQGSSEKYVKFDMSYLEFEAWFKMDEWKTYSVSIQAEQRDAMKDFVNQQTFQVDP